MKLGTQYRSASIAKREGAESDDRTVELTFSSETPVEQMFGLEVLDHGRHAVDLSHLNAKHPLLLDHDRSQQIGVVEKAWVDDERRGRAIVRFGKGRLASEIWQDVQDGIRSLVSVGYRILDMVLEKRGEDGPDTYRVTRWRPLEVSIVSIPADGSVGVGRADDGDQWEVRVHQQINHQEILVSNTNTVPAAPATPTGDLVAQERARASEINVLADKFGVRDLASTFIREGKSVPEFQAAILERMGTGQPTPVKASGEIGMTPKEVRSYSIVRAIRMRAENKPLDGLEAEASDATAKLIGRSPSGFFIPHDVVTAKRDANNVTVSGDGGHTVATTTLSMIEALYAASVVKAAGARTLSGLIGNVAFPRLDGGHTAYWLSETGSVTRSKAAFGQVALTPRRLAAQSAYTRNLLAQASVSIEQALRDDAALRLALAMDLAALEGSGADNQPRGVANTDGIGTVTFGGAPTWADVVAFETAIASGNAPASARRFITTPSVRGVWKTTAKVTNAAVFLAEQNSANGYPLDVTSQITGNKVFFGDWSELIMADWVGFDVVVDPYTLAGESQVVVTYQALMDVGVRHAAAFCVSTDAGNQ